MGKKIKNLALLVALSVLNSSVMAISASEKTIEVGGKIIPCSASQSFAWDDFFGAMSGTMLCVLPQGSITVTGLPFSGTQLLHAKVTLAAPHIDPEQVAYSVPRLNCGPGFGFYETQTASPPPAASQFCKGSGLCDTYVSPPTTPSSNCSFQINNTSSTESIILTPYSS